MMYWPTSLFLHSPFLMEQGRRELMAVGAPGVVLSQSTMNACHQIARQSPHNGISMVLVCSEGAPLRRAYLERPSMENWLALERGGFVADGQNFGFTLDALH